MPCPPDGVQLPKIRPLAYPRPRRPNRQKENALCGSGPGRPKPAGPRQAHRRVLAAAADPSGRGSLLPRPTPIAVGESLLAADANSRRAVAVGHGRWRLSRSRPSPSRRWGYAGNAEEAGIPGQWKGGGPAFCAAISVVAPTSCNLHANVGNAACDRHNWCSRPVDGADWSCS